VWDLTVLIEPVLGVHDDHGRMRSTFAAPAGILA